jgi:pyrroline-5-carboxylate reductase
VAEDGRELCARSQIVFLAVKPQDLTGLLAGLGEALGEPETFVSIAAGVEMATIRRAVGTGSNLVRAMPNRPALVGAGVTALMGDERTPAEPVDEVERLFRSAGETVRLTEEAQFDAVTALSGSGPAFVFSLIESLEAGGVACGLDPETAGALAVATVHGAARLLMELDTSPEAEREAVVAAVSAAAARSAELGRQLAEEGGHGE